MIDFACKKLNIDEIIKCSLGLSRAEQSILHILLKKNKQCTSEELQQHTQLDLSTVQRSLKHLHQKKLVMRMQKNLKQGGYVYCYKAVERITLRKKLQDIIAEWSVKVDTALVNWAKE